MSNKNQNLHQELKTALMLRGTSLSKFAKNLKKPDGTIGVSHTAVIRVAQNREQTDWIRKEIVKAIKNSRKTFPEYWLQTNGT
jgi:hypothetical protein